jgi:hypothetical protein
MTEASVKPKFRLISAARGDAIAACLKITDSIQSRDRCRRIEALQKACDLHPTAFERYCEAVGR